ncbi:hypothetical protein Hypma_002468 [Hypsizygus marmoreus]|uniref:BTB domain-containing protein n=1 Tax=Hypsizygus marmoreus TaxID=39966 RepID=A0A369JAV3_HYPMA|nr:hypothetical protein Hypma_002468 [Hypsizygus marmoreus]
MSWAPDYSFSPSEWEPPAQRENDTIITSDVLQARDTPSMIEQTVTPPFSLNPSPSVHVEQPSFVPVSTAFYPGSHCDASDLVLLSSDSVLFYVHINILLRISENTFSSLLSSPLSGDTYRGSIISIPETSVVLDALLHFLYSESCADQAPSFETLCTAVDQMPFYDIEPRHHIIPSNPSYGYLLAFAPLFPLELYALAAHFDIFHLAASTSSHLLGCSLSTISDEIAERIGAIYLNRLFHLHLRRLTALKGILLRSPYPHPPIPGCSFHSQKQTSRIWALGVAQLAWEATPDTSAHDIESSLSSLDESSTCALCQQSLADWMKAAIASWASIDRMITS